MNFVLELTSVLANVSFFGGFLLTLYGLRRPKTRRALHNMLLRAGQINYEDN